MKSSLHIGFAVLAASFFLLTATGCKSVSVKSNQYVGAPTYPPTNPAQIEVMRQYPTNKPYAQIGEIRATPATDAIPTPEIESALCNSAARLGADAIVIVSDQKEKVGETATPSSGYGYGQNVRPVFARVIVGVAIKYKPEPEK
jgi:hypothetical protein